MNATGVPEHVPPRDTSARGGCAGGDRRSVKRFVVHARASAEAVERAKVIEDAVERQLVEQPAVGDVLHVGAALAVERLEQRIVDAVEVERRLPEPLAQRRVERGVRLDNTVVDRHRRVRCHRNREPNDVVKGKPTGARIVALAETLPMMAQRRLIYVRDLSAMAADEAEPLLGYLARPNPSTVVAAVASRIDKRIKLVDADRAALSRRMQTIAEQTRKHVAKNDLAAQARSYGEIVVTCAACHAGDRTTAK